MLLANRYQIVRMLGEGGFGQTYLAEDTQMPSKRLCVIKQLKPVNAEPAVYQVIQDRFQREAAILEKLGERHSQIPELYAYFSDAGQFYLVQEWIEGETLEQLVTNQTTFDEGVVRKILLDLLPVLEFIHAQGMIHRDIKPENIILRKFDRASVLIDYGAVRETMGTVFNSRGNPTSSIVIGTPGYMPAEQAAGRPIPSSDLYSLGLTAIYLLTGKPPQMLESDPQTGEIIWQQYAPQLSPEFAAVLTQMVRSHPRDRYSSATQLRFALESPSATPQAAQTVPATLITPPAQTSQVGTAVIGSNPSTVAIGSSPSVLSNSSPNRSKLMIAGIVGSGLLSVAIVASFLLNRDNRVVPTAIAQSPSPTPTASPSASPSGSNPPDQGNSPADTPVVRRSPNPVASSAPTRTPQNIDESVILNGNPGDQIAIYSQPSTRSSSPHYGVPGDLVLATQQVEGDDQTPWYYVKFASGAQGWLQKSQTRSAPNTPSARPEFPLPATLIGQSPGSRVNIHELASTSSPIKGYGLVGDRVIVQNREDQAADGRLWYFVQFRSGAQGWVREDFIRGDD